jgi:beta-lactamase regulating signal transducer with metallopeptidase domain
MQGGEHRYEYSIGDGVSHWLYRHWGATPLLLAVGGALCVSCVLLVARARVYRDWQGRLEQPGAVLLGTLRAGLRPVQLFAGGEAHAGAFTSGVLRPRIWLPASLSPAQREAVLEHELAHVRDFDVLWFGVVGVLADVFWFLPGARLLERHLHERAEEAADAQAIARGISPASLARGILEQAAAGSLAGPLPRMAGSARRLERRLLALAPRPPRRRWQVALRLCLAAALTASVFLSIFGGYA